MKKIIAAFIAGALVATVSSVYGESVFKPIKETVYSRADIKMTLNGELLQFENKIIKYDHKTFFPVRELANKLGATVDWDEKNQTIILKISEQEANGEAPNRNNDSGVADDHISVIETSFNGLRAVSLQGEIYFSATDYNNKFYNHPTPRFLSYDYERILTLLTDGDTVTEIPQSNIYIHNGETYIHSKFFLGDI